MTRYFSTINDRSLAAAAEPLLADHRDEIYRRTDRLFAGLLVAQWIFAVALALIVSPRAWDGANGKVHPHVWGALYLGAAAIVFPLAMIKLAPGQSITRHVVAAAQVLLSSLLIHVTGGRIETHFHVFGSLAFLAFYRDWRVLITASAIVAADHFFRGVFWPQSVFGVATASPYRWMEHAGWVVFEDVFLILSCYRSQQEMKSIAWHEAGLRAAHLRTEAANQTKSQFLANMSHEIRSPMTAILGHADMLLHVEGSENDVLACVQTIRRNGDHLLSLINDILDLSKIEAGKILVERIECSPGAILCDVESLMRVRAIEGGLNFSVEFATPVPATIQSDPTRIKQILINLVGNAIKFTRKGSVKVVCRMEESAGKPVLVFEVLDTGIGMSPEDMSRLFQPFTQADGSMTRRFGGTGLGLTISRSFAEELGGTIDVESVAGIGSKFIVRLDPGSLEGVPMLNSPLAPHEIDEPSVKPSSNKLCGRVLVAEDGEDNQMVLKFYLRDIGVHATIVPNGKLAYEKALAAEKTDSPFDLILMDMQMPVMDGYTATTMLRRASYPRPIVALTAHAMQGDREKCLAAGCDGYATKPIVPNLLFAELSRHLQTCDLPKLAERKLEPARESAQWVMDSPEMQEYLVKFVASLSERATELEQAVTDGNRDAVKFISHKLAGVATTFGYPEISRSAAELETLVVKGATSLQQQADELAELCRSVSENAVAR